jgi:hypothetical protein
VKFSAGFAGSGAANISYAYLLVNASLSAAGGCFVQYNRAANTFRLQNYAGSGSLGPITLGSTASLSSSQCTITGNGASSNATGHNLTITIPTSFAFAFSGAKTVFDYAFDNAFEGGDWITTGTWSVPSSGGAAVVSAVPASGSGFSQTFTLTVADCAGAANPALTARRDHRLSSGTRGSRQRHKTRLPARGFASPCFRGSNSRLSQR